MLALERRKEILNLIESKQSIKVQDLSKVFNVTEETIRRDLDKLEKEGYIKRTYGGAVLNEKIDSDPPFNIREIRNIEGKINIAQMVIEHIDDGDILMLDSSSTALQVAKLLKQKKNITVITNSIPIILELSGCSNTNVIASGGTLRKPSLSFVGYCAEEILGKYNADKTIISCKGIRMDKGIMESNETEGKIKQFMANAADKVFLLVDGTKIDTTSFFTMLDFSHIDTIFTDVSLSQEWVEFLGKNNIEYLSRT